MLHKQRKQQAELEKKLNDARDALFSEKYEETIILCREILSLGEQEEARSLMDRALKKQQGALYDEIVKLFNRGESSVAEHKFKEYQAKYPDADQVIKQLRKILFTDSLPKFIGENKIFKNLKGAADDFFASHSEPGRVNPNTPPSKQPSKKNNPNDDFFD